MLEINKIYNMDCVEGLKLLDENSVDLIITSPPYNVGIEYDTYVDKLPWDVYIDWCKVWLTECYRVLKPDGRICVNHYIVNNPIVFDLNSTSTGDTYSQFPLFDFRTIMTEIGFNINKIAIWEDKTVKKFTAWGSWLSASSPFIQTPYEGILIGYKHQWNKIHSGISTITKEEFMEGVSGIWNLGTTPGYTKACFPEKLPKMCIDLLSYRGDLILDPFSGSGTTCYVAKNTDRNFIGFEISKNYWQESVSRLYDCPYRVENVADEVKNFKEDLW